MNGILLSWKTYAKMLLRIQQLEAELAAIKCRLAC